MNYFAARRSMASPSVAGRGFAAPPTMPMAGDVARFVNEGLIQPVLDGLTQAAINISDSLGALSRVGAMPGVHPGTGRALAGQAHRSGCGCDCCCECCCHEDLCHCRCCIVDADLVIYSRLGEKRVVPLTIENRWRRERHIKMELSGWTTRGGAKAPIQAVLLPPAPEFDLAPCGRQDIVLGILSIGAQQPQQPQTDARAKGTSATQPGEPFSLISQGTGQRLPDVDDCVVYYADLRVEGCDRRALRIALAVLPRDCNAFDIECRCECC